jgi:orotidine-5'-phosphate decarboxylase
MISYAERLSARIAQTGSHLCVGLDPRADLIAGDWVDFFRRVAEETAPHAAAFKPNLAYFEALGARGLHILERVLAALPSGPLVILDAKRSDIPETMKAYAQALFDTWGGDAVTLNPLLGFDSLEPFLDRPGKGAYLLAITSNPGAADLELRDCDGRPLWTHVQDLALRAADRPTSTGLVAGLTNLDGERLQQLADLPLLVPGFGAQGGDLARLRARPRSAPVLVNASRSILYAQPERSFADKAAQAARDIAIALGAPA